MWTGLWRVVIGLRWGIKGPFASYHDGGGIGGLEGFLEDIGRTVEQVWNEGEGPLEDGWKDMVVKQTESKSGNATPQNFVEKDRITKRVLEVIREELKAISREKAQGNAVAEEK
jgi:hypothetical protein